MSNVIDVVRNPLYDVNNILPKLELSDITPDLELRLKNEELLLLKAFPALGELAEFSQMINFLLEVIDLLHEPIEMICKLCKESSLAVLLIGSLLSIKQPDQYTWGKVCKGLAKLVKDDYFHSKTHRRILFYCIDDLSSHLQSCFYFSAFYPIGSEIPATRLTKIWIAEGETLEDTANKYLEEFVQRSLVWVSRRSSSGTIKYFQVPRVIHEFVQVTCDTEFLHVNPTNDNGMNRVVILPDNNNQYREVKIDHLRCFIASDLDRDVLGTCPYLRVLELRNSTIRDTILTKLYYLQHLGLRGNNISTLPENINNMKYLQTLDVRDTKV
ncbi:disease resistance protein Pik-2-like isoform X1 [Carex rostrata]